MILSLMLLMAMQQQVQSPCDTLTCIFATNETSVSEIVITGNKEYCDKPITFGKTKKKIADLFPEECGPPITGHVFTPEFSTGSFEIHPPTELHFLKDGGLGGVPEAEDVPAIQEEQDVKADCNSCSPDGTSCTAMACDPNYTKRTKVTTCSDKTRILMHDEQNPPKFWCYAPHQ